MNENVKKEKKKKRKGWEKDEENEKVENKKLKWLLDQLEIWNLDQSSDVNGIEWNVK